MSAPITAPVPRSLDNETLFYLKRHLVLNAKMTSGVHPFPLKGDFENTAIKISSSEVIERFFQNNDFRRRPFLPERSYLVASTSEGYYPIYNSANLKEFILRKQNDPKNEWKVLEISKKLFDKLLNDVNLDESIVYVDCAAEDYDSLPEEFKLPMYDRYTKFTVIKRRQASWYCNLM
ncbi:MAG: hypothetical protein H0X29_02005 [Parachlamydiaceae bacterium]|nr:hypothetical protein [Parachlamydiaceae bacterium]